jgi:hypothetical protein
MKLDQARVTWTHRYADGTIGTRTGTWWADADAPMTGTKQPAMWVIPDGEQTYTLVATVAKQVGAFRRAFGRPGDLVSDSWTARNPDDILGRVTHRARPDRHSVAGITSEWSTRKG